MNKAALIDQITISLAQAAQMASVNLPDGIGDVKENPEKTRLLAALAEASEAAYAITTTNGVRRTEFENPCLNIRKALRDFDDPANQFSLFHIVIGEYDLTNDIEPSDLYPVLVAADDMHMACFRAEEYCANSLGRPVSALKVLDADSLTEDRIETIRRQIRS